MSNNIALGHDGANICDNNKDGIAHANIANAH